MSGPYALNGCPLRRVNQRYLLATKTKVDVSGVAIPEHVNDAYFKRAAAAKKAAAAAGKKVCRKHLNKFCHCDQVRGQQWT